ncbi:MAG: hydrogenase expression/formation protein HypE [bacterium]|nr:hydrogenase expression/formation protein HypE [bacterium]
MIETDQFIRLDHGEGGAATHRLIQQIFLKHFGFRETLEDASILSSTERIAFSTDCFVVKPLFFPGGNIGKLSICGTINDLAVMGAKPQYLSVGFILEEGLSISTLDKIVEEMNNAARFAKVEIVAGDTKVVGKGEADQIYITTTGIGFCNPLVHLSASNAKVGDVVLINGTIAEHGAAIIVARENYGIEGDFVSDCQALNDLCLELINEVPEIHCMRDPTRGGIATTLLEIANSSGVTIELDEQAIPIRSSVKGLCELLGFDPLYIASEGRVLVFVPEELEEKALQVMRTHSKGRDAKRIGKVTHENAKLLLRTNTGGKRPLIFLEGTQLPRIC